MPHSGERDRNSAPRDFGNRERDADTRADLDKPLPTERPQSRRHRDHSNPITSPDSRPVPDSAPRDLPSREREPESDDW